MYQRNVILAALVVAAVAFAQNPIQADSPFQVRYAVNLTTVGASASYVNVTNTGANGASVYGSGYGTASGNICVNVYAFDANEEMLACCSCFVTPDETLGLNVVSDIFAKPLTGAGVPATATIKLLATLDGTGGSGGASGCNNSAAAVGTATTVAGLAAWGTTVHTVPVTVAGTGYAFTETAFTPSTLGAGELASLASRCAFIIGNGTGYGICKSCEAQALGASKM